MRSFSDKYADYTCVNPTLKWKMVKYISTSVTFTKKLYFWAEIICEKNMQSTDSFLSLLLYGITFWYESTRFVYIMVLFGHQFTKLQIYSVKSRTPFYPCINRKSFLMIMQILFLEKDYYLLY